MLACVHDDGHVQRVPSTVPYVHYRAVSSRYVQLEIEGK